MYKKLDSTKSVSRESAQRQLKVGELVRHAVAEFFYKEVMHDPDLGCLPITVSEVRMTPDLKHAKIFLMPLGGVQDRDMFLKTVQGHVHELRKFLARKVNLRFNPELDFRIDYSFEQAERIEILLQNQNASPKADI